MANTTNYCALYERIGERLVKHLTSNGYNMMNVLRSAGNISEGSQVERLLNIVLEQDKESDEKIKELEEQMEDMYDEDGVIANRHKFGLVLEDELDKVKKLQEEQTEFYEKIQKENLDTILILTEQVKKLKEQYQPKGSRIDAEGLHDFMNDTIQELKYENEKYKKMFDNLPNDMDGKRWCVKHQRWRWDDDGFVSESEDESEGEITEEEAESEDEKKEFLERHNISEDDLKELMKQCEGRICHQ